MPLDRETKEVLTYAGLITLFALVLVFYQNLIAH
jgi:hypothetical protein